MTFLRRYHRVVRALLFIVLLAGLVAAWRADVDPHLLELATYGQLGMMFLLLGVAALLTHRLARWIAPAAKGQIDEDSDTFVAGRNRPDF